LDGDRYALENERGVSISQSEGPEQKKGSLSPVEVQRREGGKREEARDFYRPPQPKEKNQLRRQRWGGEQLCRRVSDTGGTDQEPARGLALLAVRKGEKKKQLLAKKGAAPWRESIEERERGCRISEKNGDKNRDRS